MATKFIRVHGRIVPIRDKRGTASASARTSVATKISDHHKAESTKYAFGQGVGLGIANIGGHELLSGEHRIQASVKAFNRGNMDAGTRAAMASGVRGKKLGLALAGVGVAALAGSTLAAIYHQRKANKAKRGSAGLGHELKSLGAAAVGFFGTAFAANAAVVGGTVARPFTKRFGEYRRAEAAFKRAKFVKSSRPVMGLLSGY